MFTCPCCSDLLLRHARREGSYFLCQRCRIEVPVETPVKSALGLDPHVSISLSPVLPGLAVAQA